MKISSFKRFLTYLTSLLIVMSLCGCAGTLFAEKAGKAVVRIKTSPNLNPDQRDRPSPIVLYIYQLKSDDSFKNAPFFELYENPSNLLGNDLLGQQEIEISPGEKVEMDRIKLDVATQHLGFLAAYRDLDRAIWRAASDTPTNSTSYIEVTLGKLSITAKQGKKRSKFLD